MNQPQSLVFHPIDPAYAESDAVRQRTFITTTSLITGDIEKAVRKVWEVSEEKSPSLRVPLGDDAVEVARGKARKLVEAADKYERWGSELKLDD